MFHHSVRCSNQSASGLQCEILKDRELLTHNLLIHCYTYDMFYHESRGIVICLRITNVSNQHRCIVSTVYSYEFQYHTHISSPYEESLSSTLMRNLALFNGKQMPDGSELKYLMRFYFVVIVHLGDDLEEKRGKFSTKPVNGVAKVRIVLLLIQGHVTMRCWSVTNEWPIMEKAYCDRDAIGWCTVVQI